MNSTQTTRARELAHEHFVIREVMQRIEAQIERTNQAEDRALHWDLLSLVSSFRDHLGRHFALEEAGGLLGDAVEYYDDEARRMAVELIEQHRGFERRMDRIQNQLGLGVRDTKLSLPDLAHSYQPQLRELLADLSTHERAENLLLQRAILEGSE
jgi:hypothetical protein